MELTTFDIWLLLTVVPNLSIAIGMVMFMCVVMLIATGVRHIELSVNYSKYDDMYDTLWYKSITKNYKVWFTAIIVCISLQVVIPSKNEVISMVVLPPIINSENVHNISSKSLEFIEKYLDVSLEELSNKELTNE